HGQNAENCLLQGYLRFKIHATKDNFFTCGSR
ncbi:hypothetical protein SSYM_1098, partial [Serratia symbiotica str. Tucson]